MSTNTERQRRFKEKMYEAGFKQSILWVKRKETKRTGKIEQGEFMKKLAKNISEWSERDRSDLFNLFIKIMEAKKEVIKLRDKE